MLPLVTHLTDSDCEGQLTSHSGCCLSLLNEAMPVQALKMNWSLVSCCQMLPCALTLRLANALDASGSGVGGSTTRQACQDHSMWTELARWLCNHALSRFI